jgi:ATP-dependent Zn protease
MKKGWTIILIAVVVGAGILGSQSALPWQKPPKGSSLSRLYRELRSQNVREMEWRGDTISATLKAGESFNVRAFETKTPAGRDLIEAALQSDVELVIEKEPCTKGLFTILGVVAFPIIFIAALYIFLIKPAQSVGPKDFSSK